MGTVGCKDNSYSEKGNEINVSKVFLNIDSE